MGFLFDMLEKANGQNCHSTNFLRTFGSLSNSKKAFTLVNTISSPSAGVSLGLLEEHSPNTPLTVMIQTVNRFLLDKIAADYRQLSPQISRMDQVR
jgi:PAB-dependent poly(A)-specific ribonuclease subunit 2